MPPPQAQPPRSPAGRAEKALERASSALSNLSAFQGALARHTGEAMVRLNAGWVW